MVTVKSYFLNQTNEGKTYVCLELIGDIEILTSKAGKFYADVKRCKIPTRIDEATAKTYDRKGDFSRSIVKKECAAFEYTIVATGEEPQAVRYVGGRRHPKQPQDIERLPLPELRRCRVLAGERVGS